MTRSRSAGLTRALARAKCAAFSPRVADDSLGSAMRRSRIPVRDTIQSSLVLTIDSRSRFVRMRSGQDAPQPVMMALTIDELPSVRPGARTRKLCQQQDVFYGQTNNVATSFLALPTLSVVTRTLPVAMRSIDRVATGSVRVTTLCQYIS